MLAQIILVFAKWSASRADGSHAFRNLFEHHLAGTAADGLNTGIA